MNGAHNFKPEDRSQAISRVQDYANGGEDLISVFEQDTDLTFPEREADLKARIKTATAADRSQLHFDLALLRSLRYAVASSRYCLVLGLVNNVRELYEGQRITTPLFDE